MHSEEINELATALAKAQAGYEAVIKSKTVKVSTKTGSSFSYSYAPLESIFSATRKALADNGLAVIQCIDEGDGGTTLETKLVHSSGQWISSLKNLGQSNDPQQFGSKLTYFRRYQLSAILGISSEDDDDANAASGNDAQPVKRQQPKVQIKPDPGPAPKKNSNGAKSPAETGNPQDLFNLVNAKTTGKPYNHVGHMFNAIKDELGADNWTWPDKGDKDGWEMAYKAAKAHADAKAEPVAA